MKIQAINGFKDILPEDALLWQSIEQNARDIFHRFGMREIRVPIMEKTELFVRSIGEATDVVEKEMYSFPDKGITMRPEATASIMRAFIENGLHVQLPVQRLYTIGPMFRHERPQKGRQRQFHQLNAEIVGANQPEIDAELIAMGQMLLDELGIQTSLEMNSLGCSECRPPYRQKLIDFLHQHQDTLCEDCKRRTTTNPLRVLDCKKRNCKQIVQDAPSLLDVLCSGCSDHFDAVTQCLNDLEVPFTLNRFMVRGLDYYTQTTFEFITTELGSQSAVGAGGRYDGLIEELGGPSLPGIGFAMGIERIALLMQKNNSQLAQETDIFIVALGPEARRPCGQLTHALRKQGIKAAMDYSGRSLKAQMKQANRVNADYTLIIGENELTKQEAVLRDMNSKEERSFPLVDGVAKQSERLVEIIQRKN